MPRRRHHNNKDRTSEPRPATARSAWKRASSPISTPRARAIPSSVRDLVWLEMEPLLKRERARCEGLAAELHRSTEQLEQFRSRWEPGFSRWYYTQFGEKITRARDLEAKAHELERLIVNVETEALLTGESERAAYERLERIRAGMERLEEFRSKEHTPDEELPPEVLEVLKSKLDELLGGAHIPKAEYERLFDKFKQEFREQLEQERRDGATEEDRSEEEEQARAEAMRENRASRRRAKHAEQQGPQPELPFPAPADPDETRRKQLYRELARKLHPDLNTGLSPRERELWHEVQDAYDARDLEQLEMLASMIQGAEGKGGFTWIKSLSKLRAYFVELQRKLRASQKALKQARKSPAWNFDESTGKPARATEASLQIDWELTDAICSLEEEVARFEHRIKRWKSQGRSRRK